MSPNGMATSQKNAIDALNDWSKWVIGIGFMVGVGCVVVFLEAGEGLPRIFLILAISAFALSVLSAVLFRYALALTVEQLPLAGAEGQHKSIYDHPMGGGLSVGHLARAQLGTMVLGALFFMAWVILLPPS